MEDMINEIMAVMLWQTDKYFHPLTCGNIECDSLLLPSIEHGCVVLKCPCCSYVQDNIPTVVTQKYFETIEGHVLEKIFCKF